MAKCEIQAKQGEGSRKSPVIVDIELVKEGGGSPLAIDFYNQAIHERDKQTLTIQDIDKNTHKRITTSLFETAIDKFKLQLINDDDCKLRTDYANCCYDLGTFINVVGYLEIARTQYNILLEKLTTDASLHCRIGEISIKISSSLFSDYDDDDDNKASLESSEQLNLLKTGIDSFEKAKMLSRGQSNTKLEIQIQEIAGNMLLDYANTQIKHNIASGSICATLEKAVQLISQKTENLTKLNSSLYFTMATIQSTSDDELTVSLACKNAQDAISFLKLASIPDHHLLGNYALLLSSLETDDDEAMAIFDFAGESLQKAFELNPENEDIKLQLIDLGILEK